MQSLFGRGLSVRVVRDLPAWWLSLPGTDGFWAPDALLTGVVGRGDGGTWGWWTTD